MRKVAVLGSTGSIGTQTLEVAREQGDIEIVALSCGGNIKLIEEQMREFRPKLVSVWTEEDAEELRVRTKDLNIPIASGMNGLLEVATIPESEVLVTAIVGMLGIRPTIAAIEAGKNIALANKETLVTAGHIIMPLARKHNVSILPVGGAVGLVIISVVLTVIAGLIPSKMASKKDPVEALRTE